MYRAFFGIQSPLGRAVAGVVLLGIGVLSVLSGAGHPRLVAVGVILVVGGIVNGVRALAARRSHRSGDRGR